MSLVRKSYPSVRILPGGAQRLPLLTKGSCPSAHTGAEGIRTFLFLGTPCECKFDNPSVKNQRFLPAPFTQGSLGCSRTSAFFDSLGGLLQVFAATLWLRSDPLEIRCPGAKAPGKELASSSRCQGTVHRTVPLNFSNLRVYQKRDIPSGISLFW